MNCENVSAEAEQTKSIELQQKFVCNTWSGVRLYGNNFQIISLQKIIWWVWTQSQSKKSMSDNDIFVNQIHYIDKFLQWTYYSLPVICVYIILCPFDFIRATILLTIVISVESTRQPCLVDWGTILGFSNTIYRKYCEFSCLDAAEINYFAVLFNFINILFVPWNDQVFPMEKEI